MCVLWKTVNVFGRRVARCVWSARMLDAGGGLGVFWVLLPESSERIESGRTHARTHAHGRYDNLPQATVAVGVRDMRDDWICQIERGDL